MMMGPCRSLLFVLLCTTVVSRLFMAVPAKAEEAADSEIVEEGANEEEGMALPTARAIFPKASGILATTFHAGSRVDSLIAFRNNHQHQNRTVLLVGASVAPAHAPTQILQNFSAIRHARVVQHGESASFHYTFTPHPLLEPNNYHLVIGLYYKDMDSEQPHYIAAFNETIAIEASLETEFSTILTYLMLLVIAGVATYMVAVKFGILALLRGKPEGSSERRRVEVGTKGDGYDPDYVSEEHLRFKEAFLMRRSSQSPKKK